jgi:hypothetical protein
MDSEHQGYTVYCAFLALGKAFRHFVWGVEMLCLKIAYAFTYEVTNADEIIIILTIIGRGGGDSSSSSSSSNNSSNSNSVSVALAC